LNSPRAFISAVALGAGPLYAVLLSFLAVALIALVFLIARELKRTNRSKEMDQQILRRLAIAHSLEATNSQLWNEPQSIEAEGPQEQH
jgi:hypothetical protein